MLRLLCRVQRIIPADDLPVLGGGFRGGVCCGLGDAVTAVYIFVGVLVAMSVYILVVSR